jgi:beta-glucanase (GH16 family)
VKRLLLLVLFAPLLHAQTQGCSVSGSDTTGDTQSYAYCQPGIIDGRIKGGWIALRRVGDQSNSELQCYDPENVVIQNGFLTEILRNNTQTCHYWPAQVGSSSVTQNFTSAFVQWNTYSFTYGDIIVRAKSTGKASNGSWPALWLLGANCEASSKVTADNGTFGGQTCNWPNPGSEEIDFFEQDGSTTNTQSTCNLLANTSTTNFYTIADPSLGFHLYEVRWTVGQVQWYYDGVLQSGCTATATVPSTPMFLQMNIATASFATTAAAPSTQIIDWVKVCQPSPCSGNGGNIVFYDDFVTAVAPSVVRPIAKAARFAGGTISPSILPAPRGMFARSETPKEPYSE